MSYTTTKRSNVLSFNIYRKILCNYITEDCIKKIEEYWYSMYYWDIVQKVVKNSVKNLKGEGMCYFEPSLYIFCCQEFFRKNNDSNMIYSQLEKYCRYIIYNRHDFSLMSKKPISEHNISIFMKNIKIYLHKYTYWNMSYYYYNKLFFT